MSNSVLERKQTRNHMPSEKQQKGLNPGVLNSAEGPASRKILTQLQPILHPNHQPSQTSLSEANPKRAVPNSSSNQDNILAQCSSETKNYRQGLVPILRSSSDHTAPQPLGHANGDSGKQNMLRFLTSDECETSQSILSDSSSSCFKSRREHEGLANTGSSIKIKFDDQDRATNDLNQQENFPNQASSGDEMRLKLSRNEVGDPYFSNNALNASKTFYGQKPKAMYQSLAQQTKLGHPNSHQFGILEPEQSTSTVSDGKSRNNHAVISHTQLHNQAIVESDEKPKLKKSATKDGSTSKLRRKILMDMPPMELTSVRRYYSLKPDMAFGWRPEDIHGAPIPMYFDYEQNDLPIRHDTGAYFPIYYIGGRFSDSLDMHFRFSNKQKMLGPDEIPSYTFKFPPNQNVIDAMGQQNGAGSKFDSKIVGVTKMFRGMSPLLTEPSVDHALPLLTNQGKDFSREFLQKQMTQLKELAGSNTKHLIFDSSFESGNLDMVLQVAAQEYDMYMRVDSNTRGHHQWFYFKVKNQEKTGTVKFNFVNFTKRQSLYMQGMRVNVKSMLDVDAQKAKLPEGTPMTALKNEGWVKSGDNIIYKLSKLSQYQSGQATATNANQNYSSDNGVGVQRAVRGKKKYYQLSFEYTFKKPHDEVYFAYALPYTFSKLSNYIKDVMEDHKLRIREIEVSGQDQNDSGAKQQVQIPVCYSEHAYIKEGRFCHSLSGLEVPELTITSQVNKLAGRPSGSPLEIDPSEFENKDVMPTYKFKKYIIVGARVHPGESNASFIMQGLLSFLVGQSLEAIALRKRIVFKIIPMTNPDGVIAGNYRTSLSGNDLNRQFLSPNPKLHPTVDHIKKLCRDITSQARQPDPISAFIDIHGHSRKKSVFMYGPHFPLHNERYLKSKVLPKLLDDKTQMFRFFSCKFRIEKSKIKTARVVLFREFDIMNCFTLEGSFHGFIDKDRSTTEFTTESLQEMGAILGRSMSDYTNLVDDEDRQKAQMREVLKNKKKKIKAKDITRGIVKNERSMMSKNNNDSAYSDAADTNEHQIMDGVTPGMARLNNRPTGVRSLSIQNNSTKAGSLSDTHSDQGCGADNGNRNLFVKSSTTTRSGQADRSALLSAQNNNNVVKDVNRGATNDIMELISEEELSVCRSEGSPPRKKKQRRQNSGNNNVELSSNQAAGVNSKKQKGNSTAQGKKITSSKVVAGGPPQSANFKIKPEKAKRTMSEAASFSNATGGRMTMQQMMNQIKRDQQAHGSDNDTDSADQYDETMGAVSESSCGKSFSGDELSDSDLKEVQGDILGAIRRFDDLYNKATSKDKQSKDKVENKKVKRAQQKEKNEIEQKRKRKKQREDLMQAAKNAQPAVTMPFQVKGSGNGGNSCTLVMQRIMQQREQANQQNQQQAPYMTGAGKRIVQQDNTLGGFMQRHKKSIQSGERENSNRAVSDINFNVPKSQVVSNLDQNVVNKKQAFVVKKRDNSQNNVPSNGALVGLKGISAMSDLRNSKSNQNHQLTDPQAKTKSIKDRELKSQERQDPSDKFKPSQNQRQPGIKPARLLKPSSTSVTAVKSPVNAAANGTNSASKIVKIPKSTKPSDGYKKKAALGFDEQNSTNFMPPLAMQSKQTPKGDSSEGIMQGLLSKSQSKTIQVSPPQPKNLPQVQIANSGGQGTCALVDTISERQSKICGLPKAVQSTALNNDLDQPKIISMTLNMNKKPAYQQYSHVLPSSQEYNMMTENQTQNQAGQATDYRVKNVKKKSYISSQRCSSGNIVQRSKVTSLAKENTFLSKVSNKGQITIGAQQKPQSNSEITQQSYTLKPGQVQNSQAHYQSFTNQPHSSNHMSCPASQRLSTCHQQQAQQQFGVIGLASQKLPESSGQETAHVLSWQQNWGDQQSSSAFAMINQASKQAMGGGQQDRVTINSNYDQQLNQNQSALNSNSASRAAKSTVQASNESTLVVNSFDNRADFYKQYRHQPIDIDGKTTQSRKVFKENFGGKVPSSQVVSKSKTAGNNIFNEIGNHSNSNVPLQQTRNSASINCNKNGQAMRQSNNSMRVKSLGKQIIGSAVTTGSGRASSSTVQNLQNAHAPPSTCKTQSGFFSNQALVNGSVPGDHQDHYSHQQNAENEAIQFSKLVGIQKFIASKPNIPNNSTQNGVAQSSNSFQHTVMQRRRNLKAPNLHSMSCNGLNGIMTIKGSSGSQQANTVAKLNLSAQNMHDVVSSAARREAAQERRQD